MGAGVVLRARALGSAGAFSSGRQRLTWSRAKLRGARQDLMALELIWEFGKGAFGCGRGVRLRARAFLVVWLLEFGL